MTTQTLTDIGAIVEGIMDARSITDDAKALLLNELKAEGPTDVMMEKVDALFAEEIARAEAEMGGYLEMLGQLQVELTEEEGNAVPAMVENSLFFRDQVNSFVAHEKERAVQTQREVDGIVRTSSDNADANEADAIRKSLGLE